MHRVACSRAAAGSRPSRSSGPLSGFKVGSSGKKSINMVPKVNQSPQYRDKFIERFGIEELKGSLAQDLHEDIVGSRARSCVTGLDPLAVNPKP